MATKKRKNPTSNVDITPSITLATAPLILVQKFGGFLEANKLKNQMEKQVRGLQNIGFVEPAFQSMMKSVGWQSGQMWCAWYVKLVLMQLFSFDREWLSKNIGGGAINNFNTVVRANQQGDNRYVAFTNGKLNVGDVFVSKTSRGGHTGIVYEILDQEKGLYKTIEGNTAANQTREGDKSQVLTRTLIAGQNAGGGQTTIGFFRRVFTPEELELLNYDEANQTFVFTQPKKTFYLDPFNTAQK